MSEKNILYGYLKSDLSTSFEIGEPKYPCNMLDNLNEMKSSFKVIIENSTESAYAVNTICRHDDTNTFWVIKEDTSSFIGEDSDGTTLIYRHTINLEDLVEYLSYKYLPPCVFPKDRYTLAQFVYRLQVIAKLNDFNPTYPNFMSSDYKMKYFSFRNHTLASAIKEVSKSANAIPKLTLAGGVLNLNWVSRYGDSSQPLGDIDTIFTSRFRTSNSSSGQYTTRVYSDLENAKDTNVSVFPNGMGIYPYTPNSLALDTKNTILSLPTKIDSVEKIQAIRPATLMYRYFDGVDIVSNIIWEGYITFDNEELRSKILDYNASHSTAFTNDEVLNANIDVVEIQSIQKEFQSVASSPSAYGYYSVKPKKFYDELEGSVSSPLFNSKKYCLYYEEKSNEIKLPEYFWSAGFVGGTWYYSVLVDGASSYRIEFSGMPFCKIYYKPIANITLSYDNDSEAQDERPYNQTGKLIDGYTASKLVSVYVDESASENLVRKGEYYTFASIPTCGQKVLRNNIQYVINQRSIDLVSEDVYQVEFNLSIARTARDENISADDGIEKGAIPDDNLMRRVQVYKDYVEISINRSATHTEVPYINTTPLFDLDDDYGIGFDIKMDCVAETIDSTSKTIDYLYIPTTKHNFVREMIYRADFNDNYILGIQQKTGGVQKPIRYADANGEVDTLFLSFVDEETINATLSSTDFADLPQISHADYDTLVASSLIEIDDNPYFKSSWEIPVFEYIYEIKGDINRYAQVLLADNILERFNVRYSPTHWLFEKSHYYYVISTIPITQENAQERWDTLYIDVPKDVDTDNVLTYGANAFTLYATYGDGINAFNTTPIQDKHIGIYAVADETSGATPKFIMAINYYKYVNSALSTKDYSIPVYINNWKI